MQFEYSEKVESLRARLQEFMDEFVYPNDRRYHEEIASNRNEGNPWQASSVVESLKPLARERGLWNLFLPFSKRVPEGLTNFEYAPLCEIMGRVPWSPEVFNCSAPDTGNMETLERFGTEEQKRRWLDPLLSGDIRSAFLMTEPEVASSDATNIECSIERNDDEYVINGRKWFSSGAGHPACTLYIVMGKTDKSADKHLQQSMILVPSDTPGIRIVRHLNVFGYDAAPHGHMEIELQDVRVPVSSILLGEGRGFEVAQGRLGPGRIHHCMRAIGVAERALEMTCRRLLSRSTFGRSLSSQGVWQDRIAQARCMIDQTRLLTLKAAHRMDTVGNKVARAEIAMIKVAAPKMLNQILDWAVQAHGAAGVTDDFGLGAMVAHARALRIVDGPDEVHMSAIAKLELRRYAS